MTILNDLEVGRQGELLVIDLFITNGLECYSNKETKKLSYYDLEVVVDEKTLFLEIKNDRRALDTGNLAIEMKNVLRDVPSGLTITTADIWVVILGTDIYMTKTDDLRKFVEDNKPKKTHRSNVLVYIYPKELILPIFNKVNSDNLIEVVRCIIK